MIMKENNFNTEYEGLSYEQIADALHMELFKKLPEEGERHTQYVRVASHMRSIVDNNPDWLFEAMPRHGWDEVEEMRRICKDVTKEISRGQTRELKAVLKRLHEEQRPGGREEQPLYTRLFDELKQEGLPDGYKQCLIGVPEKDQMNAFVCITAALTPFVDHLKYRYADNTPDRCNLQVLVYGPAGCGKSVFSNAIKPLTDILKEADGKELKKLTDYKKIKSQKERENTPRPTPLLRLGFADVTAAGLKELVYNAKGRNIFFTTNELSRLNCDEVADILRLGYDNQEVDAYRVTDEGVTGRDNANISCVLLGTEDQARNFCFGGSRGQNGSADRIIPCQFVEDDDEGNIPWYEARSEEDERRIRDAAEKLQTPLEEEPDMADCSFAIRQWVSEKNTMLKTLPADEKEIVKQIRNRSAKNGYRAAIPYLLLSGDMGQATKVAIMVAEFCFQQRYRMVKTWGRTASYTEKPDNVSIAEAKSLPNNDDLLKSQLGEYFTYADLSAVYSGSSEAARAQVKRWRGRDWVAPAGKDGKFSRFKNLLYVHQ